MYNFAYHRPKSLDEAARQFEASSDGVFMAGGMTLIPTLKQRLASPSDVIDLGGIAGLASISREAGTLVVGASTRHAAVASSAVVRENIPALATLAGMIGDPQVRNRGTLGGATANNDPAGDYPAALLGLSATVRTTNREIAADAFFTGMFETALESGEIITSVSIPVPEKAGYAKFPNPASRYALVGVFVSLGPAGTRVAVTGAGACVFRAVEMERALTSSFSPGSLDSVPVSADGLNSDIHASTEYRAHLLRVMAKRAVAACS